MNRGPRDAALAMAVATLAALGVGSDCDGGAGVGAVAARSFEAELHARHTSQLEDRSQPVPGIQTWTGTARQVDIQMVAPVSMAADVFERDTNLPIGDACVFLDAPGQLGDLGGRTDSSNGQVGKTLVATTYDVVVAPDCLLGDAPSRFIPQVLIDDSSSVEDPFDWSLPERFLFLGRAEYLDGTPIDGAIVTFFDADQPERHVGITRVTDEGAFSAMVPEGQYHIVVSAPSDGSVPIPPIRIDNQPLPYPNPELTTLVFRFPSFPPVTLIGDVFADDATYAAARVLVEGWVPPAPSGSQFTGGFFRAEVRTNAQGRFEIDVPRGTYTIRAYPAYNDTDQFDVGTAVLEVPSGVDLIDGIEVNLEQPKNARVEVVDPGGDGVIGATLLLRMLTPPHFAYRRQTEDELGGWFGALPEGIYDVEVIPPLSEDETGTSKQWARAHATLDLTGNQSILQVFLKRSDIFDGFVFGAGGQGIGGVRVLMNDPVTGVLLDETVTNADESAGFFRGILPRP